MISEQKLTTRTLTGFSLALAVILCMEGCLEQRVPRSAPSGLFAYPCELHRLDGTRVFNYEYFETDADTEFFKFTYRPWDYTTIPGTTLESGSLFLPDGIIKSHEGMLVLVSDSAYTPHGRMKLKLMDFTMRPGDSSQFELSQPNRNVWISLDSISHQASDTIYKFRVTGYNPGRANWVFYCSKRKGIVGTYISCGSKDNFITLSFLGDIHPTDTLVYYHEVSGSCTTEQ
jgi:hypothetical protein